MLSIINYRLNEYRKDMKLSLVWIMLLTFIILLLVLFHDKMQICNYLLETGYINEEGYILVESNEKNLKGILEGKRLIISKKEYDYSVYQIKDKYIYLESKTLNSANFENNIISFKILLEKELIFNYILKTIGGKR